MNNLFASCKIENFFEEKKASIISTIINYNENTVLNYDENTVESLFQKVRISTNLDIDKSKENIKNVLSTIPMNPNGGLYISGRNSQMTVVTYTFKLKGNKDLLKYRPTTFIHKQIDAQVLADSLLEVTIYTGYYNKNLDEDHTARVNSEIQDSISNIEQNLTQVKAECEAFNLTIRETIKVKLEQLKQEILQKKDIENKLNPF